MEPMVSLARCEDYSRENVDAAMDRLLDALGGLDAFIQPGMRVLIKANLLMRRAPDRAATTHPAIVEAIARRVQALGATAVIGDSPGGPFTPVWLQSVYEGTGMAAAAKAAGARCNDDYASQRVACPDGKIVHEFLFIRAATDADAIINVPKLKTHGLTTMSSAVKNLFGLIPGVEKVDYHYRFPDLTDFSNMLVDLTECARPVLHIVDGVVGMEGEGPSSGEPRAIRALIASADPHALDVVAARLIGLEPHAVPTLARAMERGLVDPGAVRACGDPVEGLTVADFRRPPRHHESLFMGKGPIARVARRALRSKPVLGEGCVGCGICERSCPPKAIALNDKRPKFDYGTCIRCYCCQELCPKSAIRIHRPLLARVIH